MKRFFLLASLTCALYNPVNAQEPKIALSQPFDEPEEGATRLMQLKDGTTLYFQFTVKHGIRVTTFDPQHVQRAQATLSGKSWDDHAMKRSALKGMLEINGQAVLFLMQHVDKCPVLYRIIIDPKTAQVKEDAKIAELPRGAFFDSYYLKSGWAQEHCFEVEKDPESDYYAILQTNIKADKDHLNERIQVTHYSPDHKVINQAFYTSPDASFEIDYQNMYVHKDDYVFLTFFGWTDHEKDGHLIVAQLPKGSTKFRSQILDYSSGDDNMRTGLQYDAANKSVRLLTMSNSSKLKQNQRLKHPERTYLFLLSYIDPATLQVLHHNILEDTCVSNYATRELHLKKDFAGIAQDFVINPDGSTTLLLEQLQTNLEHELGKFTNGGYIQGSSYFTTDFNDIGVANINADGVETSGYAIPKRQYAQGHHNIFFRQYERNRGGWDFRTGGFFGVENMVPFFSFQYLHPVNTEYVLFNDYNRNIRDTSTEGSKKMMQFVSETNTVCYRRTRDGKIEKFFLYGDPGGKDINRYTILEASMHSPDQQHLVTIMLEKKGRHDPQAHIAWIDFE